MKPLLIAAAWVFGLGVLPVLVAVRHDRRQRALPSAQVIPLHRRRAS